jgi:hypothetical protein
LRRDSNKNLHTFDNYQRRAGLWAARGEKAVGLSKFRPMKTTSFRNENNFVKEITVTNLEEEGPTIKFVNAGAETKKQDENRLKPPVVSGQLKIPI